MSSSRVFFFAGGGTGGHIYPAIAIAEQICRLQPEASVHFFCSSRDIDSHILSKTHFEYTRLPVGGFSARPDRMLRFAGRFFESHGIAKRMISKTDTAVVLGTGGFVAGPVCLAAHRLNKPVCLLNVDIVPGRTNKLIARWSDEIFVQFEETADYFAGSRGRVDALGCPLRADFENPEPERTIKELSLDRDRKILLVTGASSGSHSINQAVCLLLGELERFAGRWQVVHLTGQADLETVRQKYADAAITGRVLAYYDGMADLLAAAGLAITRAGAVTVAECAASHLPVIFMPYPHHKDRHQYLNAAGMVQAGAAVISDDIADAPRRAGRLWENLQPLLADSGRLARMKDNCKLVHGGNAALKIAKKMINIAG